MGIFMKIISLIAQVMSTNNPKNIVKCYYPEILSDIDNCYGKTFSQKLHTFIYGDPPTCRCGKPLKWGSFRIGYKGTYCSVQCRSSDPKFVSAWYKSRHLDKTEEELYEINMKNSKSNKLASETFKIKVKATRLATGSYRTLEQKTNMELYREQVKYHTNMQKLHLLENYNKRGNHAFDDNAWHLDHIYSIAEGFKNNIPPYIIGSIYNLRMMPWRDNIVKRDTCSMSIDDLIQKVLQSKTSEQHQK